MSRLLFFLILLLAIAPCALAQNPTKVDSKHYTVEFENARVRVLRVKYGPHEKSVMHWHPAAVAIFQTTQMCDSLFPTAKQKIGLRKPELSPGPPLRLICRRILGTSLLR